MCGLYTERSKAELLRRRYDAEGDLFDWTPPERIARTDRAPVVRATAQGGRRIDILRFGLVPRWADDARIGAKLVNARGETVAEKPAFRDAFRRRRCLVPAEGYFEWMAVAGRKQPYRIAPADGQPMTFAGLWERWQPPDEAAPVDSFAIVTTTPAPAIAEIHDRMPVILAPEAYDTWLAGEPAAALALVRPYAGALAAEPVSFAPARRAPAGSTPRLL